MTTRRRALSLLWALLLIGACTAVGPPRAPMRTVEISSGVGNRCLVVLLPGRRSSPDDFGRRGFAAAVSARGLPIDLVAVDAHFGYYQNRSIVERLHADVVAPARARGYDSIWLAGTSLGGLGALLYLRDRPEDLSGVLALAPFLGDDELIAEITAAGGARRWTPPALAADDASRDLWSWLVRALDDEDVPLHLAWGNRDAFAPSNRLLAELLPSDRVDTIDGGHDMKTWARLWEAFLDRVEPCRTPTRS